MLSRDRGQTSAELAIARARVAELEVELARLQVRDPLIASLHTLPAFRAQLELDVRHARRYERPLTVAVLDLDRFRSLNMTRGYGAGDLVLGAVGALLHRSTRPHDLACRSGADEFILLLAETRVDEGRAVLERILVEMESIEAGGQRGVSASVGMAGLRQGQDADSLLADASGALALARAEGGSRVSVADGAGTEAGQVAADPVGGSADVVAALAQALEERDRYTGEHSESVVDLTVRVGEALALDAPRVRGLRTAALLHDIGKVGIPDEILHKPGPLDEREWEVMRRHPAIGERILRAIPGMGPIARIVRHEHERWDGGGYPDGLEGEAIPIEARIILACDAYHAMVSDRPYRTAKSHHDAMAELTANGGGQFDPKVVEALVGYLYGRRQAGLAAV